MEKYTEKEKTNKDLNEELIEKILYLKNVVGIKYLYLADNLGVNRQNLGAYVRGEKIMGDVTRKRITEGLKLYEPLLALREKK